ncbi:hypothetical protein [Accumulibacter sp.]|uniref:nSTAND1 domain-containing NTPase n=1 Tax=Accumulibacter sp. TaxID=2053492 RepID=UPI0025E47697|nr:hypothetical protein [Accumulibacter sp.]MCM8611419.1 hypothetical protein [Accumulibacter sp.]MCM8634934.1 hypothetical protein [Accumulibacter sp.]MCM8638547.1 hypothetical protein [Accumulibacter sp.]
MTTPMLEQYKPYKGPESYQVEDAAFFFGRREVADQIVAHVLSAQMSLLHAQSGAGKTSLLNALVIPQLEERGWTPVRVLPQNDPVRATRIACLQYVVPPPEAEALALRRALDGLFAAADDPTLDELLARYDDPEILPVRDPRKRCLIAPVPLAGLGARYPALDDGKVTPYICRLLRSSLDLATVADHLAAIATACGTGGESWQPVRGDTRVRQLLQTLDGPGCRAAYATTLDYLDLPVRELRPFIDNLLRIYGSVRPGFCLVLLFDQFEELFTRFVDPGSLHAPGSNEMPDWRLRVEFIDELRTLCREPRAESGRRRGGRRSLLPVRYLLSMRSEYIAQLRPIREFVPELDRSACQLELLTQASARQAIEEPAVLYGYTYEEECFNQILADLLKEERYIEPAHLSLVCEKLWLESGRLLVGRDAPAAAGELPTVPLATYAERLHGARGILRDFLHDFLVALADDDERREALELIEPLITGSGTRNIVERRQLIHSPFRDATRRTALLDKLVNRTLVRIEPRLGGQFIEITHEFLIPAIQEALQKYLYGNVEYQQFRVALRALAESQRDPAASATDSVINRAEFAILDRNRHRVQWNGWAVEQMLRAWLCHGSGSEQRPTLRYWLDAASGLASIADLGTIRQHLAGSAAGPGALARPELQQINANRERQPFTPAERQAILRSELLRATADEHDDVRYWTLQVMQ